MSSDLNMQLGKGNKIGWVWITSCFSRKEDLWHYISTPCAEYCVFHLHLQKELLESVNFANNKHW